MKKTTEPLSVKEHRRHREKALQKVLTPGQIARRASTKLRHDMANLAAEIYPQARGWLLDLGATEPKVALDAYLRLLEFSVPKLSRVEVEVDRSDEKEVLELSFDELKGLVHEGALLEGEARLLASRGAAGSSAESDPNADLL